MKFIAKSLAAPGVLVRAFVALCFGWFEDVLYRWSVRAAGRLGAVAYFDNAYPDLDTFAKNAVGIRGKMEILRQPIWDVNIYPTAGVLQLLFFQQPPGQGQSAQPIAAAAAKSSLDTSMDQPGVLASPMAFWVDGIELLVQAGNVATANLYATAPATVFAAANAATVQTGENDEKLILNSGNVVFSIMQKVYYTEGPLLRFPPRAIMRLDTSQSTNSATVGIVAKSMLWNAGKPLVLDPGFGIATQTNFKLVINWTALVPTAANNARIWATLNGWLFRAAQ